LTFTNKAAAELKFRALKTSGIPSKRVQASTFHAFCGDVLRSHGSIVGYPLDFEILDTDESLSLAQECARRAGIPELARAWSSARVRRMAATAQVANFGRFYQAAKLAEGVVDFDDLIVGAVDLFEARSEIARAYGAKFSHVLVDEYQDTSPIQCALVASLAATSRTVSIFADDDQAIFGFAGAQKENIKNFIASQAARIYPLVTNYRSGEGIVQLANRLIAAAPTWSGRTMVAVRSGGAVTFQEYRDVDEEAQAVAAAIAADISSKVARAEEIAVLTRSSRRSDKFIAALRGLQLPVSDWRAPTQDSEGRRNVSACLGILRGSLNRRQVRRLCDLMSSPPQDAQPAAQFLSANAQHPLAAGLYRVRELAFDGSPPSSLVESITTSLVSIGASSEGALAEIRRTVSSFEAYDEGFTVDQLLAELALGLSNASPADSGGIKVATLHRTKGLQWKRVYLLGLEEGELPSFYAKTDEQVAEELRLCFVGVSRAEDVLVLTNAKQSGTFARDPSRFLGILK